MNKEELYIKQLEPYFTGEDRQILDSLIEHAKYLYDSLYRYSGESYLLRTLRLTTEKILKLNPDRATIIASVLISACYSPRCDLDKIQQLFGQEVRDLVESLGKINAIKSRYSSSDTRVISKMFVTLAKDIRVIIIRLADRIENMETLQFKSLEKQKANAREILDVYVPIASRLGLYDYKLVLEDLAFRYVFPEEYKQLKKEMDDYLSASRMTIEETKKELEVLLKENGFDVSISGRIKNLFSVFKKLKKKTATLHEIYDIYAMRVVLKTLPGEKDTQLDLERLYKMLSILHAKYEYLPDRFKDYVANPKPNGYKSLHTALIGLNTNDIRRPTELQIRTDKMHTFAENGHAAHWIYKESQHLPQDTDLVKALSDLRKNLTTFDPGTVVLKVNLYQDRIFVLTPENLAKELPIGSTPVDFAYAIHSDIGHSCYLAKVNGNVVSLDYQLKSGDIVEIIRSPKINTKLSWLGFVKTKLARNRIKNYFRALDKDSLLEQGREEFNQLLDSLKIPKLDETLSFLKVYKGRSIPMKEREEILEEIGAGVITVNIVFKNATGKAADTLLMAEKSKNKPKIVSVLPKRDLNKTVSRGGAHLLIGGETDMPYRISSCCRPRLTDGIVAYVTKNNGVSIHKVNCSFVLNADASRLLEAKLETSDIKENSSRYHVSILLELQESQGQLKEIIEYLDQHKVTILSFSTEKQVGNLSMKKITIDVLDDDQLDGIIADLGKIPGVLKVTRV